MICIVFESIKDLQEERFYFILILKISFAKINYFLILSVNVPLNNGIEYLMSFTDDVRGVCSFQSIEAMNAVQMQERGPVPGSSSSGPDTIAIIPPAITATVRFHTASDWTPKTTYKDHFNAVQTELHLLIQWPWMGPWKFSPPLLIPTINLEVK